MSAKKQKLETPKEKLENVIKDLEEKTNPKSAIDGILLLNKSNETQNPNLILDPMIIAAEEFEKKVGRNMTYSEMRQMFG